MKKIYILLSLVFMFFALSSCSKERDYLHKKYEFSKNKEIDSKLLATWRNDKSTRYDVDVMTLNKYGKMFSFSEESYVPFYTEGGLIYWFKTLNSKKFISKVVVERYRVEGNKLYIYDKDDKEFKYIKRSYTKV